MENSKIVNLDALDKIAKELRRKALADISQQEEEIEKVRDMFGGKSFRYVLQEEYDNLSEEEKNDPSIVWSIIDAEESVSKEYVDNINDSLQESINNIDDLKADKSDLFSGDYNDLENKPVYDTRTIENVVLEIDKDMDLSNYETKDMLIIPDRSYYLKLVKLRPAYPGDIDNMKESGTLTMGEDTIPIKQVIEIDPDGNYGEGIGIISEFLIIVERDEFNYFPGGPIESGIWLLHSTYIIDENGEHVEQASGVELYDGMIIRYDSLSSGELRQLDEKFLPNLVGKCTTGKTFTVYDNIEDMHNNTNGISAVAGENAEIFNSKDNVAVGSCSHAEGEGTIASGNVAHAEGYKCIANKNFSHAEGMSTFANGYVSHTEGDETVANGRCAHAEGQGTIASGENQHVQGKFNIEDTEDKYAHIVGGGRRWGEIVDGEMIDTIEPKNIHTLDWNGNAWFQGNISIDGTPTNDKDLTTKLYVDNAIAQASIGGEIDTSGFALKTELPTKLSDLEDDLGLGDCDLTGLQTKEDNNLTTENKNIVGAINELESEVFDIAANVISMDVYKADKTYVDEQLSNVTNNGITEAELDLLLEEIFGINNKNELTSVRL